MHVAGGPDAFLEEHAVIVMSDHSQTAVEDRRQPGRARSPTWRVLTPARPGADGGRDRGLPVGALGDGLRARRRTARDELAPRAADDAARRRGRGPRGHARERRGGRALGARGELRFAPGGELDGRARRELERSRATTRALELDVGDGRVTSATYPDALGRLWSALDAARTRATCWSRPTPGYEFVDWGGADHVGGGSHGSLHRGRLARACCCSAASTRPSARAVVASPT